MGTRHRTKTNKTQHIKQKRWGARDRTITRGLTCSRRGSNYCRQSRDTGNNGHKTQDEDKQNTTYKTKRWGARDRTITRGLTCSRRGSNYCRQSRDTGNNGHKTQDEDKQNTTYKTKKMRSTRPYNNPRVNVLTKRK